MTGAYTPHPELEKQLAIATIILVSVWTIGGLTTLKILYDNRHMPALSARFLKTTCLALFSYCFIAQVTIVEYWYYAFGDDRTGDIFQRWILGWVAFPTLCIMYRLVAFASLSKV